MTWLVFLALIFGAFLHASWNSFIKQSSDKSLETAYVIFLTAIVALPLLTIFGLPKQEVFPYIALSVLLHVGYYYSLSSAYKYGDFSLAYPVMRGSAPLILTIFQAFYFKEIPSYIVCMGIGAISIGIFLLGIKKIKDVTQHRKVFLFAFLNAVIIALYTIVDGIGVNASETPWSYISLLMFADGFLFPILLLIKRGWGNYRQLRIYLKNRFLIALLGAIFTMGSYGIALWAMTQAPISIVAALRELSVLIAIFISWYVLKEVMSIHRILGIFLIISGAVSLRLFA